MIKTSNFTFTIAYWQREVHALAHEKGWYDGPPRNPLEMHALISSEIGEATEEARKDLPPVYFFDKNLSISPNVPLEKVNRDTLGFSRWKPQGEAVELADAIIRILDYAAYRGWNMEEVIQLKHNYNKEREYRHGGKKY